MIRLIMNILESDEKLKTLLNATVSDNRIRASQGDDFRTQIVYRNTPIASQDFIEQNRLTLSIIDDNDALIEAIDRRIKELLLVYENIWFQDDEVYITAIDYQDGNQEEWVTEGGPKLLKRDINLRIVWRYK